MNILTMFTKNKKNIYFVILGFVFVALFVCLFVNLSLVKAQTLDVGLLEDFRTTAGYGEASLPQIIGRIVRIILSLLGLIAVIIIIIGGLMWMTSGGSPEKIDKAKKIIINALIGLLIVVSAYAIASFIISKLGGIVGPVPPGPGGCTAGQCCAPGWRCSLNKTCSLPDTICSSSFDQFRITKIQTTHGGEMESYHRDVYLCSAVQPVFNSGVNNDKIQDLADANELRIESEVCLGGTADGKKCNPPAGGEGVTIAECQTGGGSCLSERLDGNWQTRNNVVIFKHPELFENFTSYSAYLPKQILDKSGRTLQDCQAAGSCLKTASYFVWNFTTGETVDNVPPEIVSTSPIFNPGNEDYPERNVSRKPSIRVGFSEPIDPTTIMNESDYLIPENVWLAELDGENGAVVETLSPEFWQVIYGDKDFRLSPKDDNLLKSFTWYRVHIENIEDLCLNKMAGPVEWEFQVNDRAPGVSSWNPRGVDVCSDTDISLVFNTSMYNYEVTMTVVGPGFNPAPEIKMRPSAIMGGPYVIDIWNGSTKIGVFRVVDPGEESDDFRVFSFNPENNLQDNAEYSISIGTDLIIDRIGTRLSHSWDFTTSSLEDCLCLPWISSLEPGQGGRGECITIQGSCFTGTSFQPALPSKLEFVLNENPTEAEINGYAKDYVTTVVPLTYSEGDRPQAQVTITYSGSGGEMASDLPNSAAEFFVNSNGEATGPCLFSLNPNIGSPKKTLVDLRGIRFVGSGSESNQVKFYSEKVANYSSWTETKIEDALVPAGAQTGNVVVINDVGTSNGVPFTIREYNLPIITNLSPNQGTNDPLIPTYVTISGQNFGSYPGSKFVKFGDYQAEIGCDNWSNNEIVAIVPEKLRVDPVLGYSDYPVSIIDPSQGESNKLDFRLNNTFNPAICQLSPNYGQKGTAVSIIGENFGDIQGDSYIRFGSQTISEIKEDNWSNVKINITVPEVIESKPEVAVYVPSPIETGNPLKPSNLVSFYKPPVIISISPDKGAEKTWVTIRGKNFGSIPGEVYFRVGLVDYLAGDLPDYCPLKWTETEVIVEVPEELPAVPEDRDNYQIQVYLKTATNVLSNLFNWKVNRDPLAPALCSINPEKEYPGFSPATILGIRFDLGAGDSDRKLIFNKDQEATTLTWDSDGEIDDIIVPLETISGDVVVKKMVTLGCQRTCDGFLFAGHCFGNWGQTCKQDWVVSNPLYFTSLLESEDLIKLPQVIEDKTCLETYQSPSPWPGSLDICSNVGVSARFDKEIAAISLVDLDDSSDHPNIIIEKCNSGDEIFDPESCVVISGKISLIEISTDPAKPITARGFLFTPDSLLDQNYWYQAILKSGKTGIKDVNGYQLDGNKNGQGDDSPIDDYQWYFKTREQAGSCSAERVLVNEVVPKGEEVGLIIYPETKTRDYYAVAMGPSCQVLVGGITWDWESSNQFAAVIVPKIDLPDQVAAKALALGETEIQATVTSSDNTQTNGFLNLIVATKPTVIQVNPVGGQDKVCRNVLISAVFDQEMDSQNINNQTIELYRGLEKITEIEIGDSPDEGNKTRVELWAKQALEKNQEYGVKIKAGEDGVKSKYNIPTESDIDWNFTTGEDVCQLSSVKITATNESNPETSDIVPPKSVIFYRKDSTADFVAESQDKNGNSIIGLAGLYDWEWLWDSSVSVIAKLVRKNDGESCQNDDECASQDCLENVCHSQSSEINSVQSQNKNGSSIIKATAVITTDGINQPRTVGKEYSNQGLVQVFVCENPWQYEDVDTHFMFFYCRDGEPLLPDLPRKGIIQSPSNLQASAVAGDQVEIFWIDNSYIEEEFIIERGVKESPGQSSKDFHIAAVSGGGGTITWSEVARVGENITSYRDTGLNSGIEYFYRLKSCNVTGCSEWSRISSTITFICPPGDNEIKECSITNGAGIRVRTCSVNGSWGDWGVCAVSGCNAGFYQRGNQCVAEIEAGLRIFVTGSFWSGNLGGLSGADAKCQSDANNPDLRKVWRALIGTFQRQVNGQDWIGTILLPYTKYYRADGATLIDTTDSKAWFTFNLDNTISPDDFMVWTGFESSGVYVPNYNCNGWTSSASGVQGKYGRSSYLSSGAVNKSDSFCSDYYRLYCIEQPLPPAAPSDAFATAISYDRIDLIWSDNSNNETKFEIQRKRNYWEGIASPVRDTILYNDTSKLYPKTKYYYRVRACNGGGCSNWSETTSATTFEKISPPYYYNYYYSY